MGTGIKYIKKNQQQQQKSTDLHGKSVHNCSLHFILCRPVAAGRGKGSMFVDALR